MEDNSDLISCSYCERKFSHRKNMYAHVKKFHPGASINYKKKLNHSCCLCEDTFISMSVLLSHIRQKHTDVKLIFEKKLFYSMEDFEKWKSEVEMETQSYFAVYAMGEKLANGQSFMHFRCNRSGNFKSVGAGIRRLKCAGSLKIGKTCPAHMVLYKTTVDDLMEIEVNFQSVHMGHKFEIGWLRLTSAERNLIAGEMLQGVPKSVVLTKIKNNFSPTKRLSFTTNKDLHNICRDKKINISEGTSFHEEDANSVHTNLQQLMDEEGNPIILCKPVVKKSLEEEKASLRIQFEEALQKSVNSSVLQVPKSAVITKIQKSFSPTKRLSFTNKDLHNICRDKKININEGISFHEKDANSVDTNLQQLMNEEGNPIILCKPVVKKSFEEEKASLRIQFEEALQKCVNSDLLIMLKNGVDVSMAKISAATLTCPSQPFPDVPAQVARATCSK